MTISIRRAKVEDSHLLSVAEQEIAETPGYFCSLPSELTEESVINMIGSLEKINNGIYLVAEIEGQIVGHAFLKPLQVQTVSHVAELGLAVHQGWQEKGIGTALMKYLIEWAGKSGTIEKIELNVRASNKRAIALYKKIGFIEEGRLKNRVKISTNNYIDDILMALHIAR